MNAEQREGLLVKCPKCKTEFYPTIKYRTYPIPRPTEAKATLASTAKSLRASIGVLPRAT